MDIVSSAEVHPSVHSETTGLQQLLARGSKETREGAAKEEMQPITGAPVSILDNEQRWQNLRITPNLNLPLRLKQKQQTLVGILSNLCRLVFSICY